MTAADLACYLYGHCLGRANAASREHLCAVTGWHDRTVRETIERLRRDGHCIGVAEPRGYYIGDSAAEVAEIVDSYRRRIESECVTVNMMRRNWPSVQGLQLVLVDADGQTRLSA